MIYVPKQHEYLLCFADVRFYYWYLQLRLSDVWAECPQEKQIVSRKDLSSECVKLLGWLSLAPNVCFV